MLRTLHLPVCAVLLCSCAASIELAEHESRMAAQARTYDEELAACASDKSTLTSSTTALVAQRAQLEARAKQLEGALADKQRLLDDVSSQLIELQSAFSKLSLKQKKKIVAKSAQERRVEAALARLRQTFAPLLKEEIDTSLIELVDEPDALLIRIAGAALFGKGSGRLGKKARAIATRLAEGLSKEKDVAVALAVHTDDAKLKKGTFLDTWALTGRQGLVFVRELSKLGVDPSRLRFTAYGRFKPRAANDSDEGRAQNRRLELRLVLPPI